ncbi:U3 small nucleolar RNA-associated protein 6-domain-containing protein [Sparassis latifolia]
MERVHFQQEQMLAELKDLVQRGLFTLKEAKHVLQKRTAFETALVRRVAKKGDFLRYAAYEMGLEALRRKRVERLKQDAAPPSVSDYALVRRQFHIFERALKKFKGDVGLWIQYVRVAKKERARALVGRITARALQLHPNVPALYILAASHELQHLSPSTARALLQRGIRLNADSVEMWREYVRMELGFVESLRRRWGVLGIDVAQGDKGKGKEMEKEKAIDEGLLAFEDEAMGEGEDVQMAADQEEGAEDEAARRDIMQGAIVKSVMDNAAKALPKFELFASLHDLLVTYPCPPELRDALLEHLFVLLRSTLPTDPAAIKLSATRYLTPGLKGEALIDALKGANEQLVKAVRDNSTSSSSLAAAYATFVKEWCKKDVDDTLKGYLVASLHMLAQRDAASAALMAAEIRLLASYPQIHPFLPPSCNSIPHILRLARKYTRKASSGAEEMWIARLELESQFTEGKEAYQATWAEAREAVVEGDGATTVWLWGLERAREADVEADVELLETLLRESKRITDPAAWSAVHEVLLVRYAAAVLALADGDLGAATAAARVQRVRHIATAYMPSAKVWARVFAQAAAAMQSGLQGDAELRVLEEVYEYWRREDGVAATAEWAKLLLRRGKGKEAQAAVMRARSWLTADESGEVERRWAIDLEGPPEDSGAAAAACNIR